MSYGNESFGNEPWAGADPAAGTAPTSAAATVDAGSDATASGTYTAPATIAADGTTDTTVLATITVPAAAGGEAASDAATTVTITVAATITAEGSSDGDATTATTISATITAEADSDAVILLGIFPTVTTATGDSTSDAAADATLTRAGAAVGDSVSDAAAVGDITVSTTITAEGTSDATVIAGAIVSTINADGTSDSFAVAVVHNPIGTVVTWDVGRQRDGVAVASWDPAVEDPPRVLPDKTRVIKAMVIDSVTIDGARAIPAVRVVEDKRSRHRILVSGKDVTYFRDVETPEPTYGLVSPLLWGSGLLPFPQIHAAFERPGHGDLWWLKPEAPVKVQRVTADGHVIGVTYRGFIADYDRSGRTLTCTLGGQATGRAELQDRQAPIVAQVRDIADQALTTIAHQLRLSVDYPIPSTGIETAETGGGSQLDFLTNLMAQSTTLDGRQWTIMPNDDGRYRMFRKDTTTIDFTIYLDDKRAVGNLRRDFAEEPNRIYASAVSPKGVRIRPAVYPGLSSGRDDFPGTMSEGDTGDGVTELIWRLYTMGFIDGGVDDFPPTTWGPGVTKAVIRLQDRADLDQTGVVNLATWQALFDHDTTGWSLRRSHIVPAAQRSYTRIFRRSASGQILGRNPRSDRSRILRDRTVDMGFGFNRDQVTDWSTNQLDNDLPNYVGTIDLPMGAVIRGEHNPGDPLTADDLMDARAIKPGMNGWLPTFDGGVLIHTSGAELQEGGTVQLTMDSRARDTMEAWQVITRNREAHKSQSRQWIAQNRRSGLRNDTGADRDGDVFGKIGRTFCPAGQPTIIGTPAGRSGMLQKIELATDNAEALYVVSVWGKKPTKARLNRVLGDPTTAAGTKNWQHHHKTLTNDMWLLFSAGRVADGINQLCGYAEAVDLNDTTKKTGTAAADTDTITIAGHGYSAGDQVNFLSTPSGLGADTYYVVNPTTDTFQVSTTRGGTPDNITSDATGVTVSQQNYPPITGEFSDRAGVPYFCVRGPALWLVIHTDRDTHVQGGRVLDLLLDDASG